MVAAVEVHRIAYKAIPKAACTSIKATLAVLDPDHPAGPELIDTNPREAHAIYPTMRYNRKRWMAYRDWWRFTVVRDPLRRLLAVYSDRVVDKQELKNARRLKRSECNLTTDPDPDYFFQNIHAYMEMASSIRHHALWAHLFTGPNLRSYDRIYRTDELGQLADELSERTGETIIIPRLNRSRSMLNYDDLAPETKAVIREFLEPDYHHFADYFERPW